MKMAQVAHVFKEKVRTGDVLISENVEFSGLLLSDPVLKGLRNAGFIKPSPIQLKAIPLGRCGLDMIVQAKSGTGKTCVFSVIALESIVTDTASTQVLVLAPTREIAVQIWEVINSIGSAVSGLECHTFIGGLPLHEDRHRLRKCHIAVGSPGRVKQLIETGVLKTDSIRMFILDEADKLLEEGFQDQINWIYSTLPESKQMLALSATYPEYLADHLTAYMRNPTFLRLNITDPVLLGIRQYFKTVPCHPLPHMVFESKSKVVTTILSSVSFTQCLIFSNLQSRAQNLAESLNNGGWPTACIAGCLDQRERNHAMSKLKTYKCRILISTDLTSRGIDADKVNLVINLDVPRDHETYLHRIGRAGRFGSFGIAISLVSDGQELLDLGKVEKRCGTKIARLPDPLPSDLASVSDVTVCLDNMVTSEVINTEKSYQISSKIKSQDKSKMSGSKENSDEELNENVEEIGDRNGSVNYLDSRPECIDALDQVEYKLEEAHLKEQREANYWTLQGKGSHMEEKITFTDKDVPPINGISAKSNGNFENDEEDYIRSAFDSNGHVEAESVVDLNIQAEQVKFKLSRSFESGQKVTKQNGTHLTDMSVICERENTRKGKESPKALCVDSKAGKDNACASVNENIKEMELNVERCASMEQRKNLSLNKNQNSLNSEKSDFSKDKIVCRKDIRNGKGEKEIGSNFSCAGKTVERSSVFHSLSKEKSMGIDIAESFKQSISFKPLTRSHTYLSACESLSLYRNNCGENTSDSDSKSSCSLPVNVGALAAVSELRDVVKKVQDSLDENVALKLSGMKVLNSELPDNSDHEQITSEMNLKVLRKHSDDQNQDLQEVEIMSDENEEIDARGVEGIILERNGNINVLEGVSVHLEGEPIIDEKFDEAESGERFTKLKERSDINTGSKPEVCDITGAGAKADIHVQKQKQRKERRGYTRSFAIGHMLQEERDNFSQISQDLDNSVEEQISEIHESNADENKADKDESVMLDKEPHAVLEALELQRRNISSEGVGHHSNEKEFPFEAFVPNLGSNERKMNRSQYAPRPKSKRRSLNSRSENSLSGSHDINDDVKYSERSEVHVESNYNRNVLNSLAMSIESSSQCVSEDYQHEEDGLPWKHEPVWTEEESEECQAGHGIQQPPLEWGQPYNPWYPGYGHPAGFAFPWQPMHGWPQYPSYGMYPSPEYQYSQGVQQWPYGYHGNSFPESGQAYEQYMKNAFDFQRCYIKTMLSDSGSSKQHTKKRKKKKSKKFEE